MTEDSRIYFQVASELKEREVSFYSFTPGEKIPGYISAVVTTPQERRRVRSKNIVEAREDRIDIAVERALEISRGREEGYDALTLAVDPGENTGLVVFGGGAVVYGTNLKRPEDIERAVSKILQVYKPKRVEVKAGDGGGIYRDRLLKTLKENFHFPIYLVNEEGTTPSMGGDFSREVRNIVAAVNIGMKEGVPLKGRVRLSPKEGEIKNIQKGSREINNKVTISRDLAEMVARGELRLEKAVEIHSGKGEG